ncbi:MAG: hypothetical protein R2939_00310 [Kofleriaceae bacterium]
MYHGEAVARAGAGLRVALNLGGVAVDDLARGCVIVHAGARSSRRTSSM